jgi:hypothetical protein
MPKIIKLTESDLIRIVKKVLQEQIATPTNIFGNIQNQPIGNEKFIDSNFKERGAVKNAQGKYTFPCLKKLESKKVAGTTPTQYNIAGALYSFFDNGKYSRENRTGKTQGTWKCDTQGFVELDGKQKLGKPFQWKPSPTEEDVRDGKQLLRYGMMGDFVKKVQETLGFTGTALDSKFGGNTLKAVKDFQRKNGLKDDGLVGTKTYVAMFEAKPQADPKQTSMTSTEKINVQPKGLQSVLTQKPTSGVKRTTNIPSPTTKSKTTVADTGLDFS